MIYKKWIVILSQRESWNRKIERGVFEFMKFISYIFFKIQYNLNTMVDQETICFFNWNVEVDFALNQKNINLMGN